MSHRVLAFGARRGAFSHELPAARLGSVDGRVLPAFARDLSPGDRRVPRGGQGRVHVALATGLVHRENDLATILVRTFSSSVLRF